MKKEIIQLVLLLLFFVFVLTACDSNDTKYPRVNIMPTNWNADATFLPLRAGHVFAEVPYSIEETDSGYDIIIHAVKGDINGTNN